MKNKNNFCTTTHSEKNDSQLQSDVVRAYCFKSIQLVYHRVVSRQGISRRNYFSPLTDWVVGGHEGQFSRDLHPVFPAGGPCEQFWYGQGCPLFGVLHPAFPLPTMASPTLQGVLKDDFAKAVVACDIPEPCTFPSLDSRQKRFLWTYKEVYLAPHAVVDLLLQVEDAEKFPQALDVESLDPFFSVSASRVRVLQPQRKMEGTGDL